MSCGKLQLLISFDLQNFIKKTFTILTNSLLGFIYVWEDGICPLYLNIKVRWYFSSSHDGRLWKEDLLRSDDSLYTVWTCIELINSN